MRISAWLWVLAAIPAWAQECIPISEAPYTISEPGRYCLTADLSFSPVNSEAITIAADGVTLDLRGHTIDGRSAGIATGSFGIAVDQRRSVTIRNGAIRGFEYGVLLHGGPSNINNVLEDLTILDSTMYGVEVDWGAVNIVRRCVVDNTGRSPLGYGGIGIALDSIDSIAEHNTVTRSLMGSSPYPASARAIGFRLEAQSIATNNRVIGDGSSTSQCFVFGDGTVYRDNIASACGVSYSGGVPVGTTNHP